MAAARGILLLDHQLLTGAIFLVASAKRVLLMASGSSPQLIEVRGVYRAYSVLFS